MVKVKNSGRGHTKSYSRIESTFPRASCNHNSLTRDQSSSYMGYSGSYVTLQAIISGAFILGGVVCFVFCIYPIINVHWYSRFFLFFFDNAICM